jgi:hypothetical protein
MIVMTETAGQNRPRNFYTTTTTDTVAMLFVA